MQEKSDMICVLRGVDRLAAMETKAGHADFFHNVYTLGLCALISTYPNEIALKNAYCMRFMRISKYADRSRICGLYRIRIHYADWENKCAYISTYPHETA